LQQDANERNCVAMNQQAGRGVVYLVALAAIIVILSGVRASAEILNPILLAGEDTAKAA
jgi:hypothetical protein